MRTIIIASRCGPHRKRDDAHRALLFDVDTAIVQLAKAVHDDPALVSLTGAYHNLLRMWATA
jgi:PKHD-type hydroxylase